MILIEFRWTGILISFFYRLFHPAEGTFNSIYWVPQTWTCAFHFSKLSSKEVCLSRELWKTRDKQHLVREISTTHSFLAISLLIKTYFCALVKRKNDERERESTLCWLWKRDLHISQHRWKNSSCLMETFAI